MARFTREQAIEWLVSDSIDSVKQDLMNGDLDWIANLFHAGFIGYEKFNNAELEEEISARTDGDSVVVYDA